MTTQAFNIPNSWWDGFSNHAKWGGGRGQTMNLDRHLLSARSAGDSAHFGRFTQFNVNTNGKMELWVTRDLNDSFETSGVITVRTNSPVRTYTFNISSLTQKDRSSNYIWQWGFRDSRCVAIINSVTAASDKGITLTLDDGLPDFVPTKGLFYGTTEINRLEWGTHRIHKVYYGNNLVWEI